MEDRNYKDEKKYIGNNDNLVITLPIMDSLNKLKSLKNNAIISIKPISDERLYYNNIKKIFDYLRKLNKTYNVHFYIQNRELFRQFKLLDYVPQNVNITIFSNGDEYTKEEYISEEDKLEKLAKPIRESNLSPLEKMVAVFDLVKRFRPYKDYKNSGETSRNLKYILDDNNEYIVCAGFANLLRELLIRVGIPNILLSVNVDTSYDSKFTVEEKTLKFVPHARNLVRIADDKYKIYGYYLSDATWDNKIDYDLYLNCLLTFDRKKEAKRLESLEDEDLLLDFHNVDEFINKIRFYINRKINLPNIDEASREKLRTKCYKDLYLRITNILKETDIAVYQKFFNKYYQYLNVDIARTNSNDLEDTMIKFLTEYAKYIIPLSNNNIDMETILRAAIVVKKKLYKMSNEEIKRWLEKALKDNENTSKIAFPYVYNPGNPEGYVETRSGKK